MTLGGLVKLKSYVPKTYPHNLIPLWDDNFELLEEQIEHWITDVSVDKMAE